MSSPATSPKPGATFLWVLGAFASFAILLYLIQVIAGRPAIKDPRAADRLTFKAEVDKAQADLVAKMGIADAAGREALFKKTVQTLQTRKPGVSTQVVPGSPTQLKQAAAAAQPAPAPAPAPAAAPAPAGAQPAAPAAPAPAPAAPAPAPAAAPAPRAP